MSDEEVLDQEEILEEDLEIEGDEEGPGDDPETPEEQTVEDLAQEMGWAPKDKWRGKPEEWTPAKDWIKSGRDMHLKSLKNQDAKIEDMQKTIERMAKMSEKVQARALEQARAELQAKRREAIQDGDADAVDALDKEMESLRDDEPEQKKPADNNPDNDPNFQSWIKENDWYAKGGDYEMRAYANSISKDVWADGYTDAEFYEKITEEVKKKFPEKFGNQNRSRPSKVDSGSGMRRGGKKGYSDLPPEAKQACDDFIKDGLYESREEYVKDFFED